MKKYLFILILLLTTKSFCQSVNYCDFFNLNVTENEHNGKKYKSYRPEIIKIKNNKFSNFLEKHENRFEYILFKNSYKFFPIISYFPDSIKIKNSFCENIIHKNEIQSLFINLTPKNIVNWGNKIDTFTTSELLLVASKFFYCDGINKKDTTMKSHICIGINGQSEFKSVRDLTILEAFTFEAIFNQISKKITPKFYKDFHNYEIKFAKNNIKEFTNFIDYLILIRKLCYTAMENNKNLKHKLLKYYKKNKANINFKIVN